MSSVVVKIEDEIQSVHFADERSFEPRTGSESVDGRGVQFLRRRSEQPGNRLGAIGGGICQALGQRHRHDFRQLPELVLLQIADQHDRMTRSVDRHHG